MDLPFVFCTFPVLPVPNRGYAWEILEVLLFIFVLAIVFEYFSWYNTENTWDTGGIYDEQRMV